MLTGHGALGWCLEVQRLELFMEATGGTEELSGAAVVKTGSAQDLLCQVGDLQFVPGLCS